MSLRLLGSERRQLREVLLATFDRAGLVKALGEASPARDFDHLVGSGAFDGQVFELIRRAEKEGWLEDLEALLQHQPQSAGEVTAILAEARARMSAGRQSRGIPTRWPRIARFAVLATLITGVAAGGWALWRSWQTIRKPSFVGAIGFEISPERVRLARGEDISLAVGWRDQKDVFVPAEGESWISEKPEVAKVDADGKVVAIGPGGTHVVVVARSPHGLGTASGWIDVGPHVDLRSSDQTVVRQFSIVGINDTSRIDGLSHGKVGGLARVRRLRSELEHRGDEVLVLHAGNFLYPSLLSNEYHGAQTVDVMNLLDGSRHHFDDRMFVTLGHRDLGRGGQSGGHLLRQRIEGSDFYWLRSNIKFVEGRTTEPLNEASNLLTSALVQVGGARVGLFSLTGDLNLPIYVSYFGDPLETANRFTADLRRRGAEVVVALSNLSLDEDANILEQLGSLGPDLIIGGPEHDRRRGAPPGEARLVDGRWVRRADADAASATVVRVREHRDGTWTFVPELRRLEGTNPSPDPTVQRRVDYWISKHDKEYCSKYLGRPPGCLNEVLGSTRTFLVGDESIRSVESSLGNYVADEMRRAFASQSAQVAFINSGALRLNENLPPHSAVTRRHLVELLPYPVGLRLLRINGQTLSDVVSRSVEGWPGAGHWLQVSGFAFRFDPRSGRVSDLTLLASDGPRPVRPEDEVLAVTNEFLAYGNDGYSMLDPGQIVPSEQEDLGLVILEALSSSRPQGIAPKPEGRICNFTVRGPCLAERGFGGG